MKGYGIKTVICEKIIGTVSDFPNVKVDYVEIEWHENRKRLHRLQSRSGVDIALRFDESIFERGILQDDVLAVEDGVVYAADILPCKVLAIHANSIYAAEQICWEVGNRHAPLFLDESDMDFLTPFDAPLETTLKKIEGVKIERKIIKLDFRKSLSSRGAGHHHA